MAERESRESTTAGPTTTILRRHSFRQTLADSSLPPDRLDVLEGKRRQLDESIHKYIAAKEREYKLFEREVKRRTSSESAAGGSVSGPSLSGGQQQQHAVVEPPLAGGRRRSNSEAVEDDEGYAQMDRTVMAGLKDRRASVEREKDFLGVFMPDFLPALEGNKAERTSSAPPSIEKAAAQGDKKPTRTGGVQRANSDTVIPAQHRRPAQIQLTSRTSSSGSSASASVDGRLASAMKSQSQRIPKRKRVSLAVGDVIVAPSDSVPNDLEHHSTPSHSRKRSAVSDPAVAMQDLRISTDMPATAPDLQPLAETVGQTTIGRMPEANSPKRLLPGELPSGVPTVEVLQIPPRVDPDGDLFDLDQEDDGDLSEDLNTTDLADLDLDIAGRISTSTSTDEHPVLYEPREGLIPIPTPTQSQTLAQPIPSTPHLPNDPIPFAPSSAVASQQPMGFRRPSVSVDPVFTGPGYAEAERRAAEDEVYGSSYSRPTRKGSFKAGSVGESMMEQHFQMGRAGMLRAGPGEDEGGGL